MTRIEYEIHRVEEAIRGNVAHLASLGETLQRRGASLTEMATGERAVQRVGGVGLFHQTAVQIDLLVAEVDALRGQLETLCELRDAEIAR